MKKYIFTLLAAIAMLSSCSNDDIATNYTKDEHKYTTLTCNVKTSDMYESFSLGDVITDSLRDNHYNVGVYNFLYNASGELVESNFSTEANLNMQSVDFTVELGVGDYTLVTIETLVKPSNGNAPDKWTVDNTDKLSTLKMSVKNRKMSRMDILGVCTTPITVNKVQSTVVTPKALGSLVKIHYQYFTYSDYKNVGFATTDVLESYSLDPSKSASDKFNYDLSQSGKTNVRVSMPVSATEQYMSVIYIPEDKIEWAPVFQDTEKAGTTTWIVYDRNWETKTLESGETYYSGARYVSSSTAFETYFGDEKGYKSWCNEGIITLTTPYIDWGAYVTSVESKMGGYSRIDGGDAGSASYHSTGDYYYLCYYNEGETNETAIYYYFKNAKYGLQESRVLYDATKYDTASLENTVKSKYKNSGYSISGEETTLYVTDDGKTYVYVYSSGDYNIVVYSDVSIWTSSDARANSLKLKDVNMAKRLGWPMLKK